ncbi:hypothetical protein L207DRAFT_565841 [Hyaloscypha variabilis F]|uniref:2EXR domain-containing protein n=1 Tax=Hyaloscypha variabilis (strain UAMH 11265 / GT02V1 / F) TaxID=1149755 RepID=A0A2J6RPB8_HYAVF|nr:hypothetical protein L207DRAFT_565841 [Hyaloscypha variabilis F]
MTLQTFTLFPHLPFELRLKIWDLALSEPRTVTISCHREMLDRERRFAKSFTSSTAPPPLLHVNRESRFEALSRYSPLFKTATSEVYTYISLRQDTIQCLDSVLEYMPRYEVGHIERLVLEVRDAEYFGHFHMDVVKRMESLKEVELLAGPGDLDYRWSRAERYAQTLLGNFHEKRFEDPAWRCPRMRIVNRESGEEVGFIEGGVLIEGWKEGDEIPDGLFP